LAFPKTSILTNWARKNGFRDLPNSSGVYFFHDQRDNLVYVGKSIEIRKRMQQHFSGKDRKSVKIQMNVKRVTYEVMGSELIALLYESDLIKQHQPLYNRAQRGTIYQYGLYQVDINGYIGLRIDRISSRPNGCQPVDALARDLNSPEGA